MVSIVGRARGAYCPHSTFNKRVIAPNLFSNYTKMYQNSIFQFLVENLNQKKAYSLPPTA